MNDFKTDMCNYICSGHPLLYVDTFEKDRVISEIAEIAESTDRKIYIWSAAEGWTDENGIFVKKSAPTAPVYEHLQDILNFPDGVIFVLRDFGTYLQSRTYPNYDVIISWLDTLRKVVASVRQTIIFVGPDLSVPKQLLHDITRIDFGLPDNEQISERIEFACSDVEKSDGSKFELNKEMIPQIASACRGMTSSQIVDRVALALRKHNDLNEDAIHTIVREKAGIIRASGLLTYIEPPSGGLASVGGYDAIKQHVLLDQPCFTNEAREFGIEFPKGLLLVGVPGCGKTLISLAIASELGLPLVSMDVGNLMNKFIGESEGNLREAIRMIENISPCVLQIDEIEKSFGGNGDMDGGSSRRIFGTFLKWMNDRTAPVYFVATANAVQSLPIEFMRTGRFDVIFGLDLPNIAERQEIFSIHLSKRGRKPDNFSIKKLAEVTEGFTGSDIEQVIKLGLKVAFSKNTTLKTEHLMNCVSEVIPLIKTEGDRVEKIREWCKKHTRSANPPKEILTPKTSVRKVNLN